MWLLLDDDEAPLAECTDVDGLFADLPPRPRERFTLVGCAPEGALRERGRLGDLALTSPPSWFEFLGDVAVLAHRPSAAVPGTVDVDLDGFVHVYDRTDAVVRPGGVTEFVLEGGAGEAYGTCRDVVGVFREQAPPPVPRVRLRGCRPFAVGRRIRAEVHHIRADGSITRLVDATVSGTVESAQDDVVVASDPREPLPTGLLEILQQWYLGRPTERNLWAGYDRDLRHHWAGVALANPPGTPDRPPGATYDLDGRFVTDVEGFYCAIGEAVNGPGGYFGWNLDALDDCFGGNFGARPPFRLVWHDSAVAREHLVPGYDHRRLAPAVTFGYLLELLVAHRVDVELR
ncbi:barstar family protein [Dactylosporangium sp. NPDC005572]|uniref:barstar family protein n=1 Tax=Dactylosporangium sp. NPDC005572 TaxID=3156889 RepID=UPI0033B647C5